MVKRWSRPSAEFVEPDRSQIPPVLCAFGAPSPTSPLPILAEELEKVQSLAQGCEGSRKWGRFFYWMLGRQRANFMASGNSPDCSMCLVVWPPATNQHSALTGSVSICSVLGCKIGRLWSPSPRGRSAVKKGQASESTKSSRFHRAKSSPGCLVVGFVAASLWTGLCFGGDCLLVHVQPSERGGFQVTLRTYHSPGAPDQQPWGLQGGAEVGGSAEIGRSPCFQGH